MANYEKELEIVEEAAMEAGRYLDSVFWDIQDGVLRKEEVGSKSKSSHKDCATIPDLESERILLSMMQGAFPGMPVLAEETKGGVLFPEGRGWMIDPLDGTRRFKTGIPFYSVALTRFENNEAVAGVVYAPSVRHRDASGELYRGIRGGGLKRNGGPLVMINPDEDLKDVLVAIGWATQTDPEYYKRDLEGLHQVISHSSDASRHGSGAYDLCLVAAGRLGSYFERSWGDPWSLAAGLMFVEENGGVTSDYKGIPIDVFHKNNNGRHDIQWVASKNGKIHGKVLGYLGER